MTNRSVDYNEYHSLGSMVCRPCPAAELMQGLFFQGQAVEGAAVLQMVHPGCARLMLNFLFLSPRSGFIQLLHQKPPDKHPHSRVDNTRAHTLKPKTKQAMM